SFASIVLSLLIVTFAIVFISFVTRRYGAKTKIRFAPTNEDERSSLHTVFVHEEYDDIKKLLYGV
ncbi:MAG: hypothetical protein LBI60_01555, partial [Bacteroidales bacterium]|nr:hypothetical protein [Bacteroidales bacterium]